MSTPLPQTLETRPTGYGLWWATVQAPDGRTFTGGGMTEEQAVRRARLKAAAGEQEARR